MNEEKPVGERPPDFWNLDLTKLTWAGWLLLLTLGTVIGTAVALMFVAESLGFHRDPGETSRPGLLKWAICVPALGAGCGAFALGRWCLGRAGLSILRPDKRQVDEP